MFHIKLQWMLIGLAVISLTGFMPASALKMLKNPQ
jgi:hypothetical protein